MSWYGPLLCCRYTFFTSHDYVYVADVECQVMFSLVTLYCFMCNIALVTFLGLQYWSASMINIYEHRKTCIFCVLSLVKPTKMSWNFLKIWSWNFTSCCWEPCYFTAEWADGENAEPDPDVKKSRPKIQLKIDRCGRMTDRCGRLWLKEKQRVIARHRC